MDCIPDELFTCIIPYMRPEEAFTCIRVSTRFYRLTKPFLQVLRHENDMVSIGSHVTYLDHRSILRTGRVTSILSDGVVQINNSFRRKPQHVFRVREFMSDIAIQAQRISKNRLAIMKCPGCQRTHYHAGDEGFRKAHCQFFLGGHYFLSVTPPPRCVPVAQVSSG